jgi:hypothetical protein
MQTRVLAAGVRDEDVGWLDVAVDYAVLVDVVQRIRQVRADLRRSRLIQPSDC